MEKQMKRRVTGTIAGLLMVGWALALGPAKASGQTLWNVDFEQLDTQGTFKETMVGAGPHGGAGSDGDFWNVFEISEAGSPTPLGQSLNDSTGVESPVTFTFTNVDGEYGIAAYGHAPSATNALQGEYAWIGDGGLGADVTVADFEITGLKPGGVYDLYLYTGDPVRDYGVTLGSDIAVDTDGNGNPDFTQTLNDAGTAFLISGIVADGAGAIVGQYLHNGGSESEWSGFQLEGDSTAPITVGKTGGSTLVKEENETSDSFTVVLDEAPEATVTVTVDPETDDLKLNLEGPNDPVTLTFTTSNWDTPQSVTVRAFDDALEEGEEIAVMSLEGSSSDPNFVFKAVTSAIVVDNDTADVVITESGDATDVLEGGATDSYDVVLGFAPTADVVIAINDTGDPNQVEATPTELTFTIGNWDTAQTVQVTAIDDDVAEASPHATELAHNVSSDDLGYDGLGVDNVAVTIDENDCDVGDAGGGIQVFLDEDINLDCLVDLIDFALFAVKFLNCSIDVCP